MPSRKRDAEFYFLNKWFLKKNQAATLTGGGSPEHLHDRHLQPCQACAIRGDIVVI